MKWYNGFSPEDRGRMVGETRRKSASGELPPLSGPCALCGEEQGKFQYHSEDYTEPWSWEPPATYVTCKSCHSRLHKRFDDPMGWEAFKAHIRRGGTSTELQDPAHRAEVLAVREAVRKGQPVPHLQVLRSREIPPDIWWEHLSPDPHQPPAWMEAGRPS